MSPLTTTLAGTDSMAGVHASLHNAENAAINTLTSGLALAAPLASPTLTGTPTAPTAAPGTATTQIATTAFAAAAIASLVNAAPSTLDTLSELATALGNDPNLSTTLTNLIALKAPISTTVTLTGPQTLTQKTLTSPHLTGPVVDSGGLTVQAGNVGIGGAAQANSGLLVTGSTVVTTGTVAIGLNLGPTLLATANGDGLYGAYVSPTFNVNGKASVSVYGTNIPAFVAPGAQNAYGIYVGAPGGASGENLGIKNMGQTYLGGPTTIVSGLVLTGSAAVPPAGGVSVAANLAASATAGGVQAVPATVAGYWQIYIAGVGFRNIPYFNQ